MLDATAAPFAVPEEFVPVPIDGANAAAPLSVCTLIRTRPDPALGHLVVLEEMIDGRRYLGCILDRAARAVEWLEISVQTVDGVNAIWEFGEREFTNAQLDERWQAYYRSLVSSGIKGVLTTGWEIDHPPPLFIDPKGRQAWVPGVGNSAMKWELCQDDDLLTQRGLPRYSTSLHRYLYVPAMGAESRFVPVCEGSRTNSSTAGVEIVTGVSSALIPFNLGGLMLVRALRPLNIETFADLVSGGQWDGRIAGKTRLSLPGPWAVYGPDKDERRALHGLFTARASRGARLCEILHLKLCLLEQAFREVETFVKMHHRPLLGLTADSFRIDCAPLGGHLPAYWAAAVRLVDPGCAVPAPVQKDGTESYMRIGAAVSQAFTPPEFSKVEVRGLGTVLIAKVVVNRDGTVYFEGTLWFRDRAEAAVNDLITMRLPLGNRLIDVFAFPIKEARPSPASCRFQTYPDRLSEPVLALLRQAEGAQFPSISFRLTPLVDTPCDLYGLAILAVRLLLSENRDRFGYAIVEMNHLARAVNALYREGEPVEQRVYQVIADKPDSWISAVGPHHLVTEGLSPEEAFAYVPQDLWFTLLGLITRMFPALGGDSFCPLYTSVPSLAKHVVFQEPLMILEDLVLRTRSLMVADSGHNLEIQDLLDQVAREGAGA